MTPKIRLENITLPLCHCKLVFKQNLKDNTAKTTRSLRYLFVANKPNHNLTISTCTQNKSHGLEISPSLGVQSIRTSLCFSDIQTK